MTVKYDETHDAWYDTTTKQWLETTCTDPQCDFCAHRPKLPPIETTPKKMNNLDLAVKILTITILWFLAYILFMYL